MEEQTFRIIVLTHHTSNLFSISYLFPCVYYYLIQFNLGAEQLFTTQSHSSQNLAYKNHSTCPHPYSSLTPANITLDQRVT